MSNEDCFVSIYDALRMHNFGKAEVRGYLLWDGPQGQLRVEKVRFGKKR